MHIIKKPTGLLVSANTDQSTRLSHRIIKVVKDVYGYEAKPVTQNCQVYP